MDIEKKLHKRDLLIKELRNMVNELAHDNCKLKKDIEKLEIRAGVNIANAR